MIGHFCHGLERHRLRVDRSVYALNQFLIPKLAYRFSFVRPSRVQARKWDSMISMSLSRLAGAARSIKPEIWASVSGLTLPSYYLRMTQLSDAFFRLNGDDRLPDTLSARARWGALNFNFIDSSHRASAGSNRLKDAVLIARTLKMSLRTKVSSRRGWIEENRRPVSLLSQPHPFRSVALDIESESRLLIANFHGVWGLGGDATYAGWPLLRMLTDGSWTAPAGSTPGVSSWAVCVVNDWLMSNFRTVEPEGSISVDTRRNTVVLGGRIPSSITVGNFDAELTAIARALMCIPVRVSVRIETDCKSGAQAMIAYGQCSNTRQRLRMAGRPLLELISRVIRVRNSYGAMTWIGWVRAHSDIVTLSHVGNRLADDYAKQAARGNVVLTNRCDADLSLDQHERFVVLRCDVEAGDDEKRGGSHRDGYGSEGRVVTNDPRRAIWSLLTRQARLVWSDSASSQHRFCGDKIDAEKLWLFVREEAPRFGPIVIRILSDSLQWGWRAIDAAAVTALQSEHIQASSTSSAATRTSTVTQDFCFGCGVVNDVTHLVGCGEAVMLAMRVHTIEVISEVLCDAGCALDMTAAARAAEAGVIGDERIDGLRWTVVAFGLVGPFDGAAAITAACFGAFHSDRVMRLLRSPIAVARRKHGLLRKQQQQMLANGRGHGRIHDGKNNNNNSGMATNGYWSSSTCNEVIDELRFILVNDFVRSVAHVGGREGLG